jgi:hypothetical protein
LYSCVSTHKNNHNHNPKKNAKKVLVAANYANVTISCETITAEECATISPLAKSLVMIYGTADTTTSVTAIPTTHAMMRTIASLAPTSGLLGTSLSDDAIIDGWLSYIWNSIDLPLSSATGTEMDGDIQMALTTIELQLVSLGTTTKSVYLVGGDSPSLADISLAVSIQTSTTTTDVMKPTEGSALAKWYETITSQVNMDATTTTTTVSSSVSPSSDTVPVESSTTASTTATTAVAVGEGGIMFNGVPPPVTSKMYRRHRIRIKEILANDGKDYIGETVTVAGWARTTRNANKGQLLFVELNDGSTGSSLQCVVDVEKSEGFEECKNSGGTGASFQFVGTLIPSEGAGQAVELSVTVGKLLGAVYGGDVEGNTIGGAFYAMSKKAHSLEYMRENAHLRPRGRIHAATMRIRHAMAYATHTFFHNHGFLYIHTPIITGADCEGAGEQFGVTTMLGSDHHATGVTLPVHEPPPVSVCLFACTQ